MLTYNLRIAAKSLRRTPVLSALLTVGIAIGIAVSTAFVAAYHSVAKDPIPHKSHVLYWVTLDAWDPERPDPANAAHVQLRDGRPGQAQVRPGEGDVYFAAMLARLDALDYRGALSVECFDLPEHGWPNPDPRADARTLLELVTAHR